MPKAVVCDNLKAGVTAACRYEPGINRTYQELAEHYDTAILPMRPRKPRDKAKVETVQGSDFHTGRYEHGISDFLNVLDAARQKYELEEQYAVARLAVVVAYIALYKALGGGWELYQEVPPIAKPLPAVVAAFHLRH